jgi:protein SCO1/2
MQTALEAPPPKLTLHPGWLAFAALALALPLGVLLMRPPPPADLPVLAELPPFSLVDENAKPVTLSDLQGKVWIADFVFTSCADACPRLQQKLKRIQDRLLPPEQGGNVALLSISVDPQRDTPEKLKQYSQIFGARPGLWRYLTGPETEVERTVVKGFRMVMAKVPKAPEKDSDNAIKGEAFDIMHGERLVLLDQKGRIRGYYDADEPDKVIRDARALGARR